VNKALLSLKGGPPEISLSVPVSPVTQGLASKDVKIKAKYSLF